MDSSDLPKIIAVTFLLMIPLVGIIGGIVAGILKSNNRQRLLELAQRERIAAIERGIDPAQLPAIQIEPGDGKEVTFEQQQLRRSHGLTIAGLITTFFGLAIYIGIGLAEGFRDAAPSLMFFGVGLALLISGRLVKPSEEDLQRDREARQAG